MNVVIRGLMAAATAVPAWLVVAFALTAVAALVIAGGLVLEPVPTP